jgi:uncharacterized protein (DUF1800 family)
VKSSRFIRSPAGLGLACLVAAAPGTRAEAPASPDISGFGFDAQGPFVEFNPAPSTVEYQVQRAPDLASPFVSVPGGTVNEFRWLGPVPPGEFGFYRVNARTLSADELATVNLLGRVGYGASPEELDRIRQLGIPAYLERQLHPEQIQENLDVAPPVTREWRKVTVTGTGSASVLYVYLNGVGDVYLDDLRLVAGASDNGSQPNLLKNGAFEPPLGTNWIASPNVLGSALSAEFVKVGATSLHLVSTEEGSSRESSLYQEITPALSNTRTYTLSYWYLTSDNNTDLTIRLSGRGIDSTHSVSGQRVHPGRLVAGLAAGERTLTDLRAWQLLHAVQSERQLNEVLRQFIENHFVTQYGKTVDFFDGKGYPNDLSTRLATQMEFHENQRWQAALLKPDVTFLDLLRISAESPAMIVYLDTVNSRGDRRGDGSYRVANENYARELCELFAFGVDNGYDQGDLVQLSRVWTGWTTELLAPGSVGNPFARRSTELKDPNAPTNRTAITNILGTWSLRYNNAFHDPRAKYIFHEKDGAGNPVIGRPRTVPARFGPPWAGRPYGLALTETGNGTNTIQQGYTVLNHMANQPFTQEFLVVKLCRLFLHDQFQTGYDFTDDTTSPEEDLVKAAMLAWEAPPGGGPKGQLRPVLRVILQSDLFHSTLSTQHKVKTPLEFAVSTVRAFRAPKGDGSYTADTDGYSLQTVLNRAGRMRLFDRAEPDGYPESAPGWISAGTLAERLRFVQAAALRPTDRPGGELDATTFLDPVALLQVRGPATLTDAGAVADYFLTLLFPGEGAANLAGLRSLAVNYLNSADTGNSASPLANLQVATAAYDTRVRGLVAFLLTTQRFQEQ